MNGKQIFCLSLIILSVSMGVNWFKNKPKVKIKKKTRPMEALNYKDMQINDSSDETGQNNDSEENTNNDDELETDQPEDQIASGENEIATETTEIASGTANASGSEELAPELNDPIIIAFRKLERNPFEESPYAKLIEELRAQAEVPEEEDVVKETRVLRANFNSIIKTDTELYAVIDANIYKKGDDYEDKKITDLNDKMIFIETPSALFLIPKVGVDVRVASDGSYTYEDTVKN